MTEENYDNKKSERTNKFLRGAGWGLAGIVIGVALHNFIKYPSIKQDQKFNEYFMKEIGKAPTKADSLKFYWDNCLDDLIIYEGTDTASCPENAVRLLPIPDYEKARILEEAGK